MYKISFYSTSYSKKYGVYDYKAIGSLDQIIDGARIKSFQRQELKYREWLVKITLDGKFICTRTIKNGTII